MSTILKSLKKLEQEKEVRQYIGPTAAYRGPGALSHGAKRGWIKSVWFKRSLTSLAILGLCASSIYFYNKSQTASPNPVALNKKADDQTPLIAKNTVQKPQRKASPPDGDRIAQTAPGKPPASIDKPVKKARPSRSTNTRPSSPRRNQPPPVSTDPRANNAPIERPQPISRAGDAVPQVNRKKRPAPANTQVPASQKNVASSSKSTVSKVKPVKRQPAKPSSSYDNVSSLTDGRLKVQAIVWSRIAEDRMTVINSRVLHEGDTMDGFTVLSIRADDVVVKESGGGKWRVAFGRP